MNILTAPLTFLLSAMSADDADLSDTISYDIDEAPDDPDKPLRELDRESVIVPERQDINPFAAGVAFFLRSATLLCLLVVLGGCYFVAKGASGDVVLSGAGIEMRTGTAGLAMIGIGLLFYLLIGHLIVKGSKA